MNNIFKVIWNHATQTWTAVGELASAKGKSKSVKLAAISTALLAFTGSVLAASGDVILDTTSNGGLLISTKHVTNQFKGSDQYVKGVKAATGEEIQGNKKDPVVYSYDGIAIGNGAISGANKFLKDGKIEDANGGNGHVAIGLMSRALGAGSSSPSVALGAYAVAEGQGNTALGGNAYSRGINAVAVGRLANATNDGSTALGSETKADWQATAVGNASKAEASKATALGSLSHAQSNSSIAIGRETNVSGQAAVGIGSRTKVIGSGSAVVGNDSSVSSANVSTLGSNITVAAGRDGAVVLGHGSDAGADTTKVIAVNSTTAEGSPLVYSGFSGKLGGTDTNGTNEEATGKQGNVVSVGSEGNERQIKHVAAGQITASSTDAINGSQLYQVAKTLGTAANQTANALGVTLNANGTLSGFSQPLTIAEGSDYNKDENGQKKPDITAPNVTTALTNLNNYVNAGWNVTASGNGYKNNVSIGHTVNFVGLGNVDVDGVDEENGVRTINISTDSPIDYASTTFDGKPVTKASDGKWYQVDENGDIKGDPIDASKIDKKGAKLTDSDTENNPYEKGNSYTYDDKGNITETGYDKTKPESKDNITAGKNGVQLNNVGWATQPDQAVNKDQLDQTVNKSGFYVQQNGKSTLDGKTGSDKVSDTEKVTPNDVVNFADGDGTIVKVKTVRDDKGVDTTTVSVDVDKGSIKVDETNLGKVAVDSNPTSTETQANADAREGKKLATVKNVVDAINNAGFVVSNGESNKSELINAGKKLTLKGGNGVNVEQDGSNFTFSIDSSKLLEGKTGDITVDKDKKAGEDGAGKAAVNDNDATKLATVKNVADAINGAKWFAKVENLSDSMNVRTQNDKDADAQAMGAGDILTLKADKNLAVKREGKDVTYGLASTIEVDKITVKSKTPGEATTTFENGKVTNLDDHLTAPDKVTGGNVVNATEVKTPTLKDAQKKEAATVNDVLNAGWNLKTNGNQTAAITNGKGLDFASDDNSVTITPTVDKDGNAKVNFSVNATNAINGVKGNVTAAKVDGDQAGKVTVSDADKGKLATVDTVAEAINSAATFVKVADSQEVIKKSTDDDNGVAVKSGDTVTHTAGKNLKVKRDGKSITYALAQDIDVNSVTIGSGDNATKITSDDKGLNLAGKDGAATNINNVKDADLNSTSKQAVNGSQLYATNEKVANLGTTVNNLSKVINHHAGAIDSLDRKVNKHSKQARAGIAGANAAAALPQAYTQGKAMVAAAAGTFKGQNALAVGYSRISDNGKVILKLQGNANTSGDVGAGVGVGYQW
ncbi:YadA-like family protein [Haemophilus seminalis]|uniref:YadA-like family protein n=1 Tax=Haemophilus sp. SZY H68 TaxID=2839969 RepID=UPI001C05EA94|nr:YadA-like family protein [Haemophilus sp. SZY H68]UJZ90256.1 YadA-like family protein [Haemophilus seminalis]